MSEIGSESNPLRIAIVGTGPSGMFAAGTLLADKELDVRVDLFDRLPAPFGLVRYGVAPDHQKIKKVSAVFEKSLKDPRVRFFGNISYGRDITRDELLEHYHQVIYAVGAQGDRPLGIAGEDLEGSTSSTEFVNWYNGHPDLADAQFVLDHDEVAVVGIGNVAMDVARILSKRAEELGTTDIADLALAALSKSTIRKIHILARRGPVQAKCTSTELKELGELEGAQVLVEREALELDEASQRELEENRTAQKNLELMREFAENEPDENLRQIRLHFLVSPKEIVGDSGRVTGMTVERNALVERDGWIGPEGTGETFELPVSMVVRAVGYRSKPLPDLPFDDKRAVIPNDEGAIRGEGHEREFVVGWVKRGPTGLIGTNKGDAVETVKKMLARLGELPEVEPLDVSELLSGKGSVVVDYDGWSRLDAHELERGASSGRPRVKLARIEEMLAHLDQS